MRSVVRPFDISDEREDLQGGVSKLRTLVYPGHPETRDVRWHSSIWRFFGHHPLADEMHRWVLDADGEVVGHLAAIPQYYRIGGERVVAHTPADYMVLPGYGFGAVSLMRTFFRSAKNCVACDQVQEAIAVEKKFGLESAGNLYYAAKVLTVSDLPRLPKATPSFVSGIADQGLRAVDRALLTGFGSSLEVETIEEFDESFDRLFERIAAAIPCVPEKDAAFLRWRYGPGSPQAPVTVFGVRDGKDLLGYTVLRVTQAGDNGYLLDLTTLPGRDDVARALLRAAVLYYMRAGVYIIRYRFMESHTAPRKEDLRRLGFFFRQKRRHTLLVKFADSGVHKTALDPDNWSYSVGDGEASFWTR